MKITFVGHASVLCEEGGIGLLIDPWLKGEAFNDSWALYPQPVLNDENWKKVTHIWISHEHPDHLSIPTIRAIPSDLKSQITMLFQKHYDTEIFDWIAAQGFKSVRELPHAAWTQLADDFHVACYQIGHMDSALAVKCRAHTILNLNDCDTNASTLKMLKSQMGHVDVLLDQFSIAGWPGNPDDVDRRRASARGVLDKFIFDIQMLQPDFIVPFASFVRFSHKENVYMNSIVNTLDDVAASIDENKLVAMYPGDSWELNGSRFSGAVAAMDKYRRDWERVEEQPLKSHESCRIEDIVEAANQRIKEFKESYHRLILKRILPVTFYVTDLDVAFRVDVELKAEIVDVPQQECVVNLSSQAALYTFNARFGLPTLGVSGRYTINHSERAFALLKKLGSAYSSGFYTKRLPRFGIKPRLFEFWWRRRRDIFPQFVRRLR